MSTAILMSEQIAVNKTVRATIEQLAMLTVGLLIPITFWLAWSTLDNWHTDSLKNAEVIRTRVDALTDRVTVMEEAIRGGRAARLKFEGDVAERQTEILSVQHELTASVNALNTNTSIMKTMMDNMMRRNR